VFLFIQYAIRAATDEHVLFFDSHTISCMMENVGFKKENVRIFKINSANRMYRKLSIIIDKLTHSWLLQLMRICRRISLVLDSLFSYRVLFHSPILHDADAIDPYIDNLMVLAAKM
jgi:hypothetical protein